MVNDFKFGTTMCNNIVPRNFKKKSTMFNQRCYMVILFFLVNKFDEAFDFKNKNTRKAKFTLNNNLITTLDKIP